MKKTISLFLILCLLLSGCLPKLAPRLGRLKCYDVSKIVENNLPYGGGAISRDWVELLDTDAYGRKLYRYFNDYCHYRLIQQKVEEPYTYYYEDWCYIVRSRNMPEFTEDEVNALKEANDWGKPLDESKMTQLNYVDPLPGFEDPSACRNAVCDYFGCARWEEFMLDAMGVDGNGNEIYLVTVYYENRAQEYLLLVQYDGRQYTILACEETDYLDDFRSSIISFREKYCTKEE